MQRQIRISKNIHAQIKKVGLSGSEIVIKLINKRKKCRNNCPKIDKTDFKDNNTLSEKFNFDVDCDENFLKEARVCLECALSGIKISHPLQLDKTEQARVNKYKQKKWRDLAE